MVKTLMYHKVESFDRWKAAFDGFIEIRKKGGELDFALGTLQGAPNTPYVINTWESMEALDAFLGAEDLKEAMGAAGVLEPPTIIILSELEKGEL
jgi:quinol monooxygenase YgiN